MLLCNCFFSFHSEISMKGSFPFQDKFLLSIIYTLYKTVSPYSRIKNCRLQISKNRSFLSLLVVKYSTFSQTKMFLKFKNTIASKKGCITQLISKKEKFIIPFALCQPVNRWLYRPNFIQQCLKKRDK